MSEAIAFGIMFLITLLFIWLAFAAVYFFVKALIRCYFSEKFKYEKKLLSDIRLSDVEARRV